MKLTTKLWIALGTLVVLSPLGIIVPMLDTVEEARNAVMFSKFPIGHRDNPDVRVDGIEGVIFRRHALFRKCIKKR